jgi:hypothetical protein
MTVPLPIRWRIEAVFLGFLFRKLAISGTTTRRSPRRSAFVFAPAGAYLAEFPRALDKPALSPRAFLVGRGLIAEAVDFLACHLRGFAPASFVTLTRDNAAHKTALREPLDRHPPRRMISLFAAPLIHVLQK